MIWIVMAAAAVAAWLTWGKWKNRGGAKGVARPIAMLLGMQAMLFPHELGTAATGRAADRFSTGYVFGFTVLLLMASGKRDLNSLPPIINEVFEILFGEGAGKRVIEHDQAMKSRDRDAASGAAAGREDAKRYLESGGQRQVTGWLQYVRADLFDDLVSINAAETRRRPE